MVLNEDNLVHCELQTAL